MLCKRPRKGGINSMLHIYIFLNMKFIFLCFFFPFNASPPSLSCFFAHSKLAMLEASWLLKIAHAQKQKLHAQELRNINFIIYVFSNCFPILEVDNHGWNLFKKKMNILLMCGKFPCYEKLKAFCQILSLFDPITFYFSNNDQIKNKKIK